MGGSHNMGRTVEIGAVLVLLDFISSNETKVIHLISNEMSCSFISINQSQ